MNVYKNYNKESLMFVALGVIFLKLKPCKGSCKKNSSTNGQAIKALPTPPPFELKIAENGFWLP